MSHTLHAERASLPEAVHGEWAGMRGALHAEWTKLRTAPPEMPRFRQHALLAAAQTCAATLLRTQQAYH